MRHLSPPLRKMSASSGIVFCNVLSTTARTYARVLAGSHVVGGGISLRALSSTSLYSASISSWYSVYMILRRGRPLVLNLNGLLGLVTRIICI